jgi:hypothetical protein
MKTQKKSRNRVYKNRLLRLADFLEALPRKRFDFNHWVGDNWEGKEDLSCGTTACALGWATTIPSLRKAGLRMDPGGFVTLERFLKGQEHSYGYSASFSAGKEVFDLSDEEFRFAFVPHGQSYNGRKPAPEEATPQRVGRNIRFLAESKYPSRKHG